MTTTTRTKNPASVEEIVGQVSGLTGPVPQVREALRAVGDLLELAESRASVEVS